MSMQELPNVSPYMPGLALAPCCTSCPAYFFLALPAAGDRARAGPPPQATFLVAGWHKHRSVVCMNVRGRLIPGMYAHIKDPD
jgi:hypothetical protein